MNNKKRSSAALIAASALAVSLAGCSTAGKISDFIDSGDYDRAVELYNSSELSYKEMNKLVEQMSDKLDSALEKYANGEVEYDDVASLISALNRMNISKLDESLFVASATMAELRNSKDAFEEGNKAFDNEEYSVALYYYNQVIERDSNYNDSSEKINESVTKFKEQIINNAHEMADSGEYESAISYMNDCRGLIDNSSIIEMIDGELVKLEAEYVDYKLDTIISNAEEMINKGDYDGAVDYLSSEKNSTDSDAISQACDEKISEIRKISVVSEAESLADSGDYAEALTVLDTYKKEYGSDDNDLSKLQSEISSEYVQMITEKVTALCEKENYIAALNMLSNAKEVVNAPEFNEMEKKINEVKPTYLYDLKIVSSDRYEVIDSGEALTDTVGNKYDVGNLFEISSYYYGWETSTGIANYNLGYKYNKMSGIIAVDDKSDDIGAVLTIEGDDAVIYSVYLDRTTAPVPVELDVSNVNWLKITIKLEYNAGDGSTFYAIMSDFTFEK